MQGVNSKWADEFAKVRDENIRLYELETSLGKQIEQMKTEATSVVDGNNILNEKIII
eukprot:UN27781